MSELSIKDLFNNKNRGITIFVLIVIAIGIVFFISQAVTSNQPKPVTNNTALLSSLLKDESASIDLIKSTLNVYYITYGEYPGSYDTLTQYVDNDQSGNWSAQDKKNFDGMKTELKDFSYSVRGDQKAYKLTYTDSSGKPITINGDYQNDYH